jgi:hypothetical protein
MEGSMEGRKQAWKDGRRTKGSGVSGRKHGRKEDEPRAVVLVYIGY